MQQLIAQLNPEQRAAVEATEGPLLILAGAGSGKTRVITSRIAYLVREKGVRPDSILAVTFTNKAAAEMGERVERLLGHASVSKPLIATFHSLSVRILRRDIEALKIDNEGLTRSFAIFDESDQQGIVKQVMRRLGIDTKSLTPRTVLGRISWAKNHMVDPQEYYLGSSNPEDQRIAYVYQQYRSELKKNNALDFDDLLLETVRLLKSSAEVRERYQRRFRYLLVDEYQDTNRPQYEMMKLLAGEEKNVAAVGDEDQSIYSWRGADIRNILEFEQDFPNARIVRLEQNYRSTGIILEAAGRVVANNQRRKGKRLWTERQGGSLIGYYEAPDGENEALFIADRIRTFLRQQESAPESPDPSASGHCAVLYRTNSQSRLIEEALRRLGIGYVMVGGFSFYERAEIKDLLSYLRLVRNPHDSMALARVINTPARGVGATTLATLERLALETGVSTWDAVQAAIRDRLVPARALASLEAFRRIILDAQGMMDPDFAGTLAASLESDSGSGDTDFSFGAAETAAEAGEPPAEEDAGQARLFDPGSISPFSSETSRGDRAPAGRSRKKRAAEPDAEGPEIEGAPEGFRRPGDRATLPELIRFLINRTGYIKELEAEGTQESASRIENLKELANAAHDAEVRGESLADFLDHAALASDTDKFDPAARVTLMTLHAAKGLEFPLVFLAGMEEGLFPHSRTLLDPEGLEEERRLCYVGMTRAMNTLILSRALYRRRYGNDSPEGSVASRFLEEVPSNLIEDLGRGQAGWATSVQRAGGRSGGWQGRGSGGAEAGHFNYEDESQEPPRAAVVSGGGRKQTGGNGASPESMDNIARFFGGKAARSGGTSRPEMDQPAASGAAGLRKGQRVRHAKYGEGTVLFTEGEGDDIKLTVMFARHGMKKLVERFANLQRI